MLRFRSSVLLAFLLGLLAFSASAHAAGGGLDPSFGSGGKAVTDFGAADQAFGVATQADGKIVAAGSSANEIPGDRSDFALARYNADGTLDPSFGGDGKVVIDFGGDDFAFDVLIQSDGKILAAGQGGGTFPIGGDRLPDFALARLNPDGSVDSSFDGDGKVLTNLDDSEPESGSADRVFGLAIQADGKIVAAGESTAGSNSFSFALARYNPDGSLDPTFDGDGQVSTEFGDFDSAEDVATEVDGEIVAVGFTRNGTSDFALARYQPDGSLDPTFDGDGKVVTDFFGGREEARAVAIQVDGKIVAAGESDVGPVPRPHDFALARYDPDGSLDSTFGGDGRVLTNFGAFDEFFSSTDEANAVSVQADGRIVAAGDTDVSVNRTFNFGLARYNPDGSLDPTFDGDGRVVTDFGVHESASDIAIQSDGRIVAAGSTGTSSFEGAPPINFALSRYLPGANQPPDCATVAATPSTLRPPDHKLRLVTLSGASDPDGDFVTLTVTAVSQDEPVDGVGDGDRSPDARSGTRADSVFLRAERSGSGDGRVYRVSFTGSDGKGGTCSDTVTVGVPRSPATTAVDSAPPSFDSFGP